MVLLLLTSCNQRENDQNRITTTEAFSDLKTPAFVFDYHKIKGNLQKIAWETPVEVDVDRVTRSYYLEHDKLLWIDYYGIDNRADSLVSWLRLLPEIGMSPNAFGIVGIENDIRKLRQLDFDDSQEINRVAARLEFQLTRACLRYVTGQRFGYINPRRVFNNLDVEKEDTVHHRTIYRELFDIPVDVPSSSFYRSVLSKIKNDSIAAFLSEIQPDGKYYRQMKEMLHEQPDNEQRRCILCNMERGRWRLRQPMPESGKYIVVNIPAYHLYAFDADTLLDMRIVCGAQKTKTPLLTSAIEWMEVNPQWVIPRSIVEKDVVKHVGDTAYFARNRYQIYERTTNKVIDVSSVSRSMLLSGNYRVAQQSGSDNSLGRIVFRFKNNYSVFLHYTSNPGAFMRDMRAVSHGCVRVAKPFELAQYVLDQPDEWLLDRIRISMDIKPETERGRAYLERHSEDKEHRLIGYVPVKPHVPLFLIYYTIWPDENGSVRTWPDVYGYDQIIWERLQPYI